MLRDWSYWKQKYIKEQTEIAAAWADYIESKTMSPIESIALLYTRDFFANEPFPMDYSALPQHKIGKYIIDIFVHYHPRNLKIVIECDGHEFHERSKEQAAHDKTRDRTLTKNGYIVLRYTGSQICDDPQVVVNDIIDLVYAEEE